MRYFRLKVQKIEQTCLFELTWGQGQQLMATVNYPPQLTTLYQEWRRTYLSFYKTAEMPLVKVAQERSEHQLRARVAESGQIGTGVVDWQAKLVQAETILLNAFHHWLRSAELFEIRAAISSGSSFETQFQSSRLLPELPHTNVFLTCYPMELARFPWEVWEIGADFSNQSSIRIIRTPANIQAPSSKPKKRSQARILAIFGDDTGLALETDRAAVKALSKVAAVSLVNWKTGELATTVKQRIQQAISDPQGWDVLFFAGHSNETVMTGGELAIAPNTSIQLAEIAPQLAIAKENGLQVAIFNSCSGLNIAESLIGLGFSQVVVMREPIHNRVAQEFLIHFLQSLANHQTLQEAIMAASQYLRLERNLTYPSAYLVPSLFAHPGADLFQIPVSNWKQRLRYVLPNRLEAVAIATCLTLSLLPSVQQWLLDQRVAAQAIYRDLTQQLPPAEPPPIALIQIDEESIRRDARIATPTPISRPYLAELITRLTQLEASIIGIDYLLDRPVGGEETLNQALQASVQQNRTWFVFGAPYSSFESANIFAVQDNGIAKPEWSMQAYVSILPRSMTLPYPDEDCREICPLAYLLALLYTAQQELPANTLPAPKLDNSTNLRTQLLDAIQQHGSQSKRLDALERSRLSPLSTWFYDRFGIIWLEPVIDFSIPPDRIYERVAAWRILKQPMTLPNLPSQITLIGSGEYVDMSGIVGKQLDLYPVVPAVEYWRNRLPENNAAARFPNGNSQNSPDYLPVLTGSEIHAYILHHLLTQRIVVPIPDLWMVGMALLIGKGISQTLRQQSLQWPRKQQQRFLTPLAIATTAYGLISLQLYISASILLPWFLPSLMLWLYVLPAMRKQSNA